MIDTPRIANLLSAGQPHLFLKFFQREKIKCVINVFPIFFLEKEVKAAKVQPSVLSEISSETLQESGIKQCVQQKTVTIELSEEFQGIFDALIKQAKPYWIALQKTGIIPPSKSLSSLNTDYSHFLLKQTELSLRGKEVQETNENTQNYCMTICLHTIITTANILMQSGMSSAIGRCKD